ncbi:hypothetical protein [Nocardioides nitrophenolicus]|uniref:hypothetical protein n=1 Tax=Nocardioides nitrophenolicus TaxID=60489 RepID=UPI00195BBAD4|nr:hypothetical protein [Nocardioides nitrophenolicus]MBM7517359.1 hypothetical protein [Nocardioides nitrophenolicus]
MSVSGFELSLMRQSISDWQRLDELMTGAKTSLSTASTSGLPPSVQPAGALFLQRWAGFAGESAVIARGFADALTAASDDYLTTDDTVDQRYAELDGRLGPER